MEDGNTVCGTGMWFVDAAEQARGADESALETLLGPAQLIGVPPQDSAAGQWSFQTRAMSHGAASMKVGIDLWTAWVFPVRKARSTFAGTILLGRASSSDVLIDHASISKLHARIRRAADGAYTITDAGSRNGTWVAGRQVREAEVPLPLNAKVQLGDWELRFQRLAETLALLRSS